MRYKDIKRIIDKWDPEDLWWCGCPLCEYDIDSKNIWVEAQRNPNFNSLSLYIYNRYKRDQSLDDCRLIASKALRLDGENAVIQFDCPLLNRMITEDYCSELNMEAIFADDYRARGEPIKRRDIAKSCVKCENFYWTNDVILEYIENGIKSSLCFEKIRAHSSDIYSDKSGD